MAGCHAGSLCFISASALSLQASPLLCFPACGSGNISSETARPAAWRSPEAATCSWEMAVCFHKTSNPWEPNTEAGETGMIAASSICSYPPPLHVHTRTYELSRMITGVARSCNSRTTDYIRRQAGRIVCTHSYRKTNTIKLFALLELHLPVI